ncbi:MAG: ParB/RepB/Spo0J family partition protein [Eggerthellaceae bacterium]|nr:ParB/RepB/Spo0J family partition protein [Eggerthellaceae bacterium]
MAKQKSGLGRGLNALFDDSSLNHSQSATSEKKKPEKDISSETKSADISTKQENRDSLNKARTPSDATPKTSSDIYISEDAIENAKVVSRDARPKNSAREPISQNRPRSIFQHKSTREISNRTNSAGYTNHTGVVSAVQNGAGVNSPNTKNQPQKTAVAASPVVDKVLHTVKPKEEKGSTGVVALDKVQPNPDQPRTNFKPEEIEELANSIKKEGLLQPILVRKVGENYQIIAGERRWQACKSLDMKEIPVRFWTADNDKALELALIENIQRTDLNPIEEAYGYKRLMERRGMTQSEVAQTVSKGRSTIANALRLLDLPEEAQQLLFEEKITAGHARAILSIPDAEGRKTLTQKLMDEKLSVRETEAIARLLSGRAQAKETGKNKRVPAPASFKKAARGLTRFLSVPVRVKTVQGKNKIEIQFKDEAELERILSLIAENPESKGAEKAEA